MAELKEFKGTYDEWVEWNKRMSMPRLNPQQISQKQKRTGSEPIKPPPV